MTYIYDETNNAFSAVFWANPVNGGSGGASASMLSDSGADKLANQVDADGNKKLDMATDVDDPTLDGADFLL